MLKAIERKRSMAKPIVSGVRASIVAMIAAAGLVACGGSSGGGATDPEFEVTGTTPENDAVGVDRDTALGVSFNKDVFVKTATEDDDRILLRRTGKDTDIKRAITSPEADSLVITPESPLALLTNYTVTATTGITGLDGTPLVNNYSWSFTTGDGGWGDAGGIETDNAGEADLPQIAFDSSGNAIAVWQRTNNSGSDRNIWFNRYSASSGSWGSAEPIDNARNASRPQIAIDSNDNALVVWVQPDGGGIYKIWANRYSADTNSWNDSSELIEASGPGNSGYPQIAIDSNGNALAVWYVGASNPSIMTNRYTAATDSWNGSSERLDTGVDSALSPQVAIDMNGNALAVWEQWDGSRYNIWANRYSAGTDSWGGAELVETNDAGWATSSQVVFNANGDGMVVWEQTDGSGRNIWFNRYLADSNSWKGPEKISGNEDNPTYSPQIALDASGNALVVWRQKDGTRFDIWASRYTAGTDSWSSAELIETDNAGDAKSPQVAVDTGGNALAVWHQNDGTRYNIMANRYTADTDSWGEAELIEMDNAGDAGSPQIAVDANGSALAVWQQSDDILTNRFE